MLSQCHDDMILASRSEPFFAEILTSSPTDLKRKFGADHLGVGLTAWMWMKPKIAAVQESLQVLQKMQRAMG